MGAIITLRDEIEAIITNIKGVSYHRASRTEANKKLLKSKINNCIAFHVDQTTATASGTQAHYVKVIPTEILFLFKNKSLDESLKDVDNLVDKAEDIADNFHDLLIQSSVINDLAEFDDYECQRLEAYKEFDTITSGVLYTWNAPVYRSKYYCT
jgi:hypothetical protein